jgi:hypothetical protein
MTSPGTSLAGVKRVRSVSILPRQGEVAPKATEGEDHATAVTLSSPSVWQAPATSPLRGRIKGFPSTGPR